MHAEPFSANRSLIRALNAGSLDDVRLALNAGAAPVLKTTDGEMLAIIQISKDKIVVDNNPKSVARLRAALDARSFNDSLPPSSTGRRFEDLGSPDPRPILRKRPRL
jgi:hypothetical protein